MTSEKFSIPDLTQEEQDIFQNAFAKDLENLKTNAAISPSFCDIFVTMCKMPSLSLLTDKEAQNTLQLSNPQRKQKAVLKCAEEKGPRSLVVFYLLLHFHDETAYGKLPSSRENDQKMTLISKLRDKHLPWLKNTIDEISQTFVKHRSQGDAKPIIPVAAIRPHVPTNHEETDISMHATEREKWNENYNDEEEKPPAYDTVDKPKIHHVGPNRRVWGIKKDDVFFHFITLCFALGTVLVVEHNYSDWTVSAGIGLMSFAILEAIGIYFNFVNRVRSIARAIIRILLRWGEKFPLAIKNR